MIRIQSIYFFRLHKQLMVGVLPIPANNTFCYDINFWPQDISHFTIGLDEINCPNLLNQLTDDDLTGTSSNGSDVDCEIVRVPDWEDANEGDTFVVVGADVLCEGTPRFQNRGTRAGQQVEWRVVEERYRKSLY